MAKTILAYKGNGNLQVITDSEFTGLADTVLRYFSLNDGPGNIYYSNIGGTSTPIGTFTDTSYAGAVGSGDTTVLSTTYTLYQDLNLPSGPDSPRPLVYRNSDIPIQEMTDSELQGLADDILSYMITQEGPGCYRISTSVPGDGGTWVSLGMLEDKRASGQISTSYYLYKKIAMMVTPDLYRPLRIYSGGTIKEFTNAEIGEIVKRVRQRIITTGVGQYVFQSTIPASGMWQDVGTVDNVLQDTSPATYTGSYMGSVSDTNYDTAYQLQSTSSYTSTYDSTDYYVSNPSYTGDVTNTFTGVTPGSPVTASYTSIVYFTTPFQSPAFFTSQVGFIGPGLPAWSTNIFTGLSAMTFTTTTTYVGPPLQSGNYTSTKYFTGTYPADFYGPPTYSLTPNSTYYVGTANFASPTPNTYMRDAPAPRSFTGTAPGTPVYTPYDSITPTTFVGSVSYQGGGIFDGQTFSTTLTTYFTSSYVGPQPGTIPYGVADYEGSVVESTSTSLTQTKLWRRIG